MKFWRKWRKSKGEPTRRPLWLGDITFIPLAGARFAGGALGIIVTSLF